MFELTVLFAAVGMVVTYLIRNKLWPGRVPRIFDKRTTDHLFALTFAVDNKNDEDINRIKSLLNETGAVEVNTKEFHDTDEPLS